jgi:ABC-2 type transport system ATP-binding protein
MQAVNCSQLTKTYGKITALNSVNLQIEEGQLYGLLGVNGAGKTTLIKVLIGLTLPTAGTAKVFGYDVVKESSEIKKK